MNEQKTILIFLLSLIILIGAVFVSAQENLEVSYPDLPGADSPVQGIGLPGYIKYIFNFVILLGIVLAFGTLIFGGIVWLTSSGDPGRMGDAKSRIMGGFLGLVLLLCSYLVLTTINPELTIFGNEEPLEATVGIYLCETETDCEEGGSGRILYIQNSPNIRNFEANYIRFISPPEKLTSIFVFANENYKAEEDDEIERVKNEGGTIPLSFNPSSLSFLWNKPGLYLYKEVGFCESAGEYICLEPPSYLSNTIHYVGDSWNDDTKSIETISRPDLSLFYGAVLFKDPSLRGGCDYLLFDIEDLELGSFVSYDPIGYDLSSLVVFKVLEETTGEVTFYDEVGCKGNSKTFIPETTTFFENLTYENCSISGGPTPQTECYFENTIKELDKNILSFEIKGNFEVVLSTDQKVPYEGPNFCQRFSRPTSSPCIETIKGSTIYSPETDGKRVRSILIVPVSY